MSLNWRVGIFLDQTVFLFVLIRDKLCGQRDWCMCAATMTMADTRRLTRRMGVSVYRVFPIMFYVDGSAVQP